MLPIRVGLHNHTCFSDGRLSPEQLLAQAQSLGYERFAITDHNSIAGWQSLVLPEWALPGIELSALSMDGTEVHLLGLGIKPEGRVLEHSQTFQALYNALWQEGIYLLTGDHQLAEWALNPLTRSLSIEKLRVQSGTPRVVGAWAETHNRYYQQKLRPLIPHWSEGIEWLHSAGAQVGLAHPQRYPHILDLSQLLDSVDAVEVIHPSHTLEQRTYWREQAQRRGKACWASHDFHGWSGEQKDGLLPPIILERAWLQE